jgi:F-type H+-transporting ATPase subunit epsilon
MPSLKIDIVTAERIVYSAEVDAVIAPGVEGQLGILPHHAPLKTILQAGELVVRKGGE